MSVRRASNASPPRAQNQHDVPQLYLRRFVDPESNQRSKAWVFDLVERRIGQKTVGSICSAPDLYEVDNLDLPRIEEIFSRAYESRAGQLIPQAITSGIPDPENATHFRFWIGSQFTRTRAYRDALRTGQSRQLRRIIRRLATQARLEESWPDLVQEEREFLAVEYGDPDARRLYFTLEQFVDHFHDNTLKVANAEDYWRHVTVASFFFSWLITRFRLDLGSAPEGSAFVTSDQPVTVSLDSVCGLDPPVLVYPLNPRVCVLGVYMPGPEPGSAADGRRLLLNEEEVLELNALQRLTAFRQMISADRALLEPYAGVTSPQGPGK